MDQTFQMSSSRYGPLIREEVFSNVIYRLLEVDYRISAQSGQLLPVTALLAIMVHRYPRSTLTRLVLRQVLKGYLGTIIGTEEEEDLDIIAAGSAAELGHFAFPCGDIDIMMFYRNLIALSTVSRITAAASKSEILEIVYEKYFRGFVRLRKADGMMFRHSDLEARLLRQEPLLFLLKKHGPAWIMPNLRTGTKTYDFVPAIVCEYWPSQADEWVTRRRCSSWPSRELVEKIVGCGCHVVPIGHRASKCPEYLWRLSFSKAEVMLIQSLTISQKLVYHILKGVFSELPDVDGERLLTSYHLKTLFLWCCEQFPTVQWTRYSIVRNCQRLLKTAETWLLSENWPNYFIRDSNMFAWLGNWSVFRGRLLSLDILKHSTISVMESLQDPNLFCREVLESSAICVKWYRNILLGKPRADVDELAVFVSRLDFLERDIGNYTLFREKEYILSLSGALFGLFFMAINRLYTFSPSFLENWMHTLKPVPNLQLHGDSRYLASTVQIFEAAVALQYYTVFAKSCKASTVNWSLRQLTNEHIFRALNLFDAKRNVYWPTIAASWAYFEFALNPEVVHADVIGLCDEAIELFKRDDVTSVYERRRGRQLAPPLQVFVHGIFFMVDDYMKSIGGYVRLFEYVADRLRSWLPGKSRCLDYEEFSPILITYYVKTGCLLRAYSGRPQERRELIDTVVEWEGVSRVYGSALEKFVFELMKRKVQMKDRENPKKSRVY